MPDFNLLARIAKLAALFAFFLPWVLVSCSGNEIAHGSGWQLMTGHLEPSQQINGLQTQFGSDDSQRSLDEARPEIFAIAAFAAIVLGLLAGALLRQRAAAGVMLATSLIAIGLCFGAFEHMKGALNESVEHSSRKASGFEAELGQSVASSIRIEKQEGFWITIIALAAAATLSGARLSTRKSEATPSA